MPLAPAHPAAVLPLRGLPLPMIAMVVGAVAPDLPVYLPVGVEYSTTHSARGLPADMVLGLILLWVWSALVRDLVVDCTPYLRSRLPARARLDRRAWLAAPIAVLLGAATHVLWDSVTHDWGFVVERYDVLADDLGPLPVYRWLQHLSTVLGAAVVGTYGVVALRRLTVSDREPRTPRPVVWWAGLGVTALTASLVLRDPEAVVGVLLVAGVVAGAWWRVRNGGDAALG